MPKADRRVERTRALIRAALRSLLDEKRYESLTVQQIIDRANVGRATFYAHFESKDDLFVSGFDELRCALRARQREAAAREADADDTLFAFGSDLFAHAGEYRDVFQRMAGTPTGATVERVLRKLLLDLVRADVTVALRRTNTPRAAAVEPVARFLAGGMYALLIWWLTDRPQLSATDMTALFRRMAIPALQA